MLFWYAVVFWAVVFGTLCALIAPRKGWQPGAGLVLGAVLGVFGLLYLVSRPDASMGSQTSANPLGLPSSPRKPPAVAEDAPTRWGEDRPEPPAAPPERVHHWPDDHS